jgi:hypothetical protein
MFSKTNLLTTLVTGIFLFFLGYLIWGILTVDFFTEHAGSATGVMKEEPDMLFIALSCLIQAFFLSAIYGKWAGGKHSAMEGLEFGILIGAFYGLGTAFMQIGTANLFDMTGGLANGVLEIVYYALAGVLVAIMFKATAKKA